MKIKTTRTRLAVQLPLSRAMSHETVMQLFCSNANMLSSCRTEGLEQPQNKGTGLCTTQYSWSLL